MPIAMTQEQQALQASLRDWAKRTNPIALVRSLEPDGIPSGLAPLIPLDGGTVTDLAAALEQLACALAPGPVLPTALASLLLTRCGQQKLLPALAQAQATACVALAPGTLTGTRQADGALRVTGETGPVLWAAGHLLAPAASPSAGGTDGDAWFLLEAGQPGVTVESLTPLDFSRELAAVRLANVVIPPENLLPGLRTEGVRDLAAALYAAEAAGVAAWCSGTAADYAGTRRQFGRPIGSFQAVKHLCATMVCRAERAAALAWDAARAADEAPAGHPLAAAAAAALALDNAVDNAKDCIQVLGGIGFTWEHDAHLYLRRALALRQLLGGSPGWRTRTATLAAASTPSHVPAAQPEPAAAINAWTGPAIARYGTAGQQERFLGPTQRAEITWCQLSSEPEAGSDLASLRTRAERADGGWLLTGQKVWTSLARQADWAIGLARTDPTCPSTRASRSSWSTCTRLASISGRCGRSPAARCSTRSSSTTCSCRTTACWGSPATAGGSPCPRWPPNGWPWAPDRTRRCRSCWPRAARSSPVMPNGPACTWPPDRPLPCSSSAAPTRRSAS